MDYAELRAGFHLPEDGLYLNSSALGLMPRGAAEVVADQLAAGWRANAGDPAMPALREKLEARATARLARLIGASADDISLGPGGNVQFLQALTAALSLCTGQVRRVVLTDSSLSPAERDAMAATVGALGCELRVVDPDCICYALSEEVAVLCLSEIDHRTGARRDLPCLTRLTHDAGALAIWDLSHSVGVTAPQLEAACADFAFGSTARYLCGGPGAPGFLWIAPRFRDRIRPILSGLSDATDGCTQMASPAMARLRFSRASLADLALLEAALATFDPLEPQDVQRRATDIGSAFIAALDRHKAEVTLLTPRDPTKRGGLICLEHSHAAALHARLQQNGVQIGYCPPNVLRFAFSPLYNDLADADHAAAIMTEAITAECASRQPDI